MSYLALDMINYRLSIACNTVLIQDGKVLTYLKKEYFDQILLQLYLYENTIKEMDSPAPEQIFNRDARKTDKRRCCILERLRLDRRRTTQWLVFSMWSHSSRGSYTYLSPYSTGKKPGPSSLGIIYLITIFTEKKSLTINDSICMEWFIVIGWMCSNVHVFFSCAPKRKCKHSHKAHKRQLDTAIEHQCTVGWHWATGGILFGMSSI